ncbi:hypothetical protein K3729_18555 (plasmid) [Rhodobacteraceae bacterium S2214]|nr:hypothetical protein K3729_18555 [Rhodobacteraceae bacterium S2214]
MIDKFEKTPDFPFERYFEDANQYAAALEYWMSVLRKAKGFDATYWAPRERPLEIESDMYHGKVIDIISNDLRKEINLQTWSVLGDANMLFKENSGLSPADYKSLKAKFGPEFSLADDVIAGMSYQEALTEAQDDARLTPAKIWVEKASIWHSDPTYKNGGYQIETERLVLTAQISKQGESAALSALALFLEPGSSMFRVNNAFPDGMVVT